MLQKILVPLDFSEYTDEIMNVAAQLAQKLGSTIHLLHVIPNMDYFTPYESFLSGENLLNIQREIEREVRKDMEAVAKKIKDIPVAKAIHTGVSVLEIVDYVRTEKIDLVVMGTHGRGGLEHILIGSVAEKVVRKSPCPVLTIRPAAKQFPTP